MFDIARFHIIGRVGKVKAFDGMTKVSIATYAPYKQDGERVQKTDWNEVTVFERTTRGWIDKNLKPGDIVRLEGKLRQSSYPKNGETVYTTELVVDPDGFNRLYQKAPTSDDGATGK